MFMCQGLFCHCCMIWVFVSTPGCGNGAGRQVYICSLFCLVHLVESSQVCAGMWTFCFDC